MEPHQPAPFTIEQYTPERMNRSGHVRLVVKVHGYWSFDPIAIAIRKDIYSPGGAWGIEITHSSGGRDPAAEADDITAAANFGMALIAAAHYARGLQLMAATFEADLAAARAKGD